jgi:hypothetical protein
MVILVKEKSNQKNHMSFKPYGFSQSEHFLVNANILVKLTLLKCHDLLQ